MNIPQGRKKQMEQKNVQWKNQQLIQIPTININININISNLKKNKNLN